MAGKTVTISIEEDELTAAQQSAKAAGLSFSAWAVRAIRRERLREQAQAYRDALAELDPSELAVVDELAAAAVIARAMKHEADATPREEDSDADRGRARTPADVELMRTTARRRAQQ